MTTKLKDLLEGYAWERESGKPLPTLNDVTRKHNSLKEAPEDEGGLSKRVQSRLGGVKQRLMRVFGDIDDKVVQRLQTLPRTEQIGMIVTLLQLFGVEFRDFNMFKNKIANALKDAEKAKAGTGDGESAHSKYVKGFSKDDMAKSLGMQGSLSTFDNPQDE